MKIVPIISSVLLLMIVSTGSINSVYSYSITRTVQYLHNKLTSDNLPAVDFDSIVEQVEGAVTSQSPQQKLISNPDFVFVDNQSGKFFYGLSSYWNDSLGNCHNIFKCTSNSTTGWKDKTSFQISTNTLNRDIWSKIYGREIDVNPGERYGLATHMKLNKYAVQSQIAIEGYNKTTRKWNQINQCPTGTNGPLDWHGYSCDITIPANTSKIRPVLNAGWSSMPGKEAVTLFDAIYLIRMTDLCVDYTCLTFAPIINDPNLKAQLVYKGNNQLTTMAFLGPNDFLFLEKQTGKVQRIVNGIELKKPLLNVAVADSDGLLGIAIAKHKNNSAPTYVFLYFTESGGGKNRDDTAGIKPKCNCLYRYELINNDTLANPKLLLNLPAYPGPEDNGGIVKIGSDNNVYVVIGYVDADRSNVTRNKAINVVNGADPDGRAGILRITQDGKPTGKGILGDKFPLNLYYAYGIRNSFGMAFDPITGKLWDTENGPDFGDEINLIEPGHNSGWLKMTGIWQIGEHESVNFKNTTVPNTLVDFGGKGKYKYPEFTWNQTVGPTAIAFSNSDKLGKKYENDMFVADSNHGNIYHFKLDVNRTGLLLNDSLAGKVAYSHKDLQGIIFATGFGKITDLEVGPDGYLYIVAMDQGSIYRIVPVDKLS